MADEDTNQLLATASHADGGSAAGGLAASWEHVESGEDQGPGGPGTGEDEAKTGVVIPPEVMAQVRAEAARGAREEMLRLLGDNAKYLFDQRARTQLVKQAYFAVTAEAQLSAFVRHLFTTAWVEILLMLLALLFYFGDSKASTSHFVFIFTLHILRPPALLWVLNRVPRLSAVVFAVGGTDEAAELEKYNALAQLRSLKMPIVGLSILTCLCGVMDVLAILLRLWDFKDLPQNEIAPSVLLFLLALAFTSVDFSAVFWYFSLKYNLPRETVDRLTSTAVTQTHHVFGEVVTAFNFIDAPPGSRPLASQA